MEYIEVLNPYLYHIARVTELNKPDPTDGYIKRTTLFHEIEWIISGCGKMLTDGSWIQVEGGDILYRPPGVSMHAFGDYQCYLIAFDPFIHTKTGIRQVKGEGANRFIGNYLTKDDVEKETSLPLQNKMKVHEEQQYFALFSELTKAFSQSSDCSGLKVKIKLLELLYKVFTDSNKKSVTEESFSRYEKYNTGIQNIMKKMDECPYNKILLEDLAKSTGISKYYFSRVFKVIAGMNLSDYHKNAKINYAKHLLIDTDKPIESIAIVSGYDTPTYFYKVFKREMKMTPNQYREQFMI